jgi:hypothetical protein
MMDDSVAEKSEFRNPHPRIKARVPKKRFEKVPCASRTWRFSCTKATGQTRQTPVIHVFQDAQTQSPNEILPTKIRMKIQSWIEAFPFQASAGRFPAIPRRSSL